MKKTHWLQLLLAFWVFVGLTSAALNKLSQRWIASSTQRTNNLTPKIDERDGLKKDEERFSSLNRNSQRYREYHTTWKERIRNYNSRAGIEDQLRATTASRKLAMAEPSEKNRVIENNAFNYRVEWHVIGTAADVLAWVAEIEGKIDPIVFEAIEWRSRGDQQVDVGFEGIIKLPES